MGKNTVILHLEWNQFLSRLNNEQLGLWTRAVMDYMQDETMPHFSDPAVDIAFYAAMERMGRDLTAYENRLRNLKQFQQGRTAAPTAPESEPVGPESEPAQSHTACVPVPEPVPAPEPVPVPVPVPVPAPVPDAVPVPVPQSAHKTQDGPTGREAAAGTQPDASAQDRPTEHTIFQKTTAKQEDEGLAPLWKALQEVFGPPSRQTTRQVEQVCGPLGPELSGAVLERCQQNHARRYEYFLKAAREAADRGETAESYRAGTRARQQRTTPQPPAAGQKRGYNQRVDRLTPSGNNFLQDAAHRTHTLKCDPAKRLPGTDLPWETPPV